MTPYQELRAACAGGAVEVVAGRPRRRRFDEATAKERNAENTRRHSEARRRAHAVLVSRYPAVFAALLEAERAGVDAERGPLPGDPQ